MKYGQQWTNFEGAFSLSQEGEQVFCFCFDAAGGVHHLAALSYNGEFVEAGRASYGANESALPPELTNYSIVLTPHKDNWAYASAASGTKDIVRTSLLNPNNWEGSDDSRFGGALSGQASSRTSCVFYAMTIGLVASFMLLVN